MYIADRELFGRALLEALASRYNKELEQCIEDERCSDIHLKKMSNILGYSVCRNKSKKLKKMWVAILIVAALLSLGCTAYIHREEIKGFILEIYEEYVNVKFSDVDKEDVPKTIEEEYELGYVPEGFEFGRKKLTSGVNWQSWCNEEGESIVLVQSIIDGTGIDVDNERGTSYIFEYGEYTIYFKSVETVKCYIWTDGKYDLVLEVPIYIPDEEAKKIIDNIIP